MRPSLRATGHRTAIWPLLTACGLIAACSSPPKPPQADPARKRPANAAMAVDLQACRNDLHNTRLALGEADRRAEFTAAAMDRAIALQQASQAIALLQQSSSTTSTPVTSTPPSSSAPVCAPTPAELVLPPANSIYTVQFAFGSHRANLPPEVLRPLLAQARTAPLVLLRGRTDGTQDLAAEIRIARDRADAVKAQLVAAGIDASRIRTTWQATGDHVADNATPEGQARNRRVEIEVYAALPVSAAPAPTSPSLPTSQAPALPMP